MINNNLQKTYNRISNEIDDLRIKIRYMSTSNEIVDKKTFTEKANNLSDILTKLKNRKAIIINELFKKGEIKC